MKLLSIDTASDICGISILENEHLICQLDQNTGRTHSENLMPMIEQAFLQSNLTIDDIDFLVCDIGPGSFTGIRIGIATAKGFQDSLSIPCIGISSLEVLAYTIPTDGFIISLLDCKNDHCYFALYERKNNHYTEILAPSTDTIENALKICKQTLSNSFVTFVGDGSIIYQDNISQIFQNFAFSTPEKNLLNSYSLGLAGLDKFKKKKYHDVLPLYLKKPQAQKQLEEKSKEVKIMIMNATDLECISDILLSDFDDFWNANIFKKELESENSSYLVAKLNDEIVGFAGIKILLEDADIMNIVIKKNFRNQGIGTLLLKNLINLANENHLKSLSLEVMEENFSAIHLYKKLGFEQVGKRKKYYQDKDAIIMKKLF
ncbi:MAG: tRNA (adenosine(37)-N6)-threonylcarbamoyltransferase complex dimerization subunit type 1 TsaB [Clostridia bacterium]|nr:tRNA (adenosine(37)-N6)-threonylcarbamoyltransferase complex dimerization subunit type 1 TsaB [Clostridia bacterium]